MGATFGDFSQHDGGKERVLGDELSQRGNEAIDLLLSRPARSCNRLDPVGGAGDGLPEQRVIEGPVAVEVVVRYGLLDPAVAGYSLFTVAGVWMLRLLFR